LVSTTVVSTRASAGRPQSLAPAPFAPFVHLLDRLRPDRQSPPADRLGVRHLAAADAGEVAVDQVGAHFALEDLVAPVAHVLENEQAQDHVGRRAQAAATAAFRMSPP
jgi:hypothetical protein